MIAIASWAYVFLPLTFALASGGCRVDEDCSLNGVCLSDDSSGGNRKATISSCHCDPGWTGDDCGILDLAPASKGSGYNNVNFTRPGDFGPYGNSSWGGRILQDPQNASVFHLFTSQFGQGCGLSGWRPHSYIIRAESHTGPQGPYHWAQDVTDPATGFRHNPDVVFSPVDRKYLMYSIGVENTVEHTDCQSLTYQDWPNNISVASADTIDGPWSDWKLIIESDFSQDLPVRATNPSPFTFYSPENPTGDIGLLIKDYRIYKASAWNGTYDEIFQASWPTAKENDTPYWTEDPFIWQDKRGNWHSINHWMIDLVEYNTQQWPRVGSHLFARNLTGPWHFPLSTAFTSNVTYSDGDWKLMRRRERPKLYFSTDGEVTPLYLVTGVQDTFNDTGASYTHIQPIGTKWKDFEASIWSKEDSKQ